MAQTEKVESEKNAPQDKSAKKKPATNRKIKLALDEIPDSAIATFVATLKERDIKDADLNEIVSEALEKVPNTFWEEKLEELTPLEWRVQEALNNPNMREKLEELLLAREQEKKSIPS